MLVLCNVQARKVQASATAAFVGFLASAAASMMLALTQDALESASLDYATYYKENYKESMSGVHKYPVYVNYKYIGMLDKATIESRFLSNAGYSQMLDTSLGASIENIVSDISGYGSVATYSFYTNKQELLEDAMDLCDDIYKQSKGVALNAWSQVIVGIGKGFASNKAFLEVFNDIRGYFYKQMVQAQHKITVEEFATSYNQFLYQNWSSRMKEIYSSRQAEGKRTYVVWAIGANKWSNSEGKYVSDNLSRILLFETEKRGDINSGVALYQPEDEYEFWNAGGFNSKMTYEEFVYMDGKWQSNRRVLANTYGGCTWITPMYTLWVSELGRCDPETANVFPYVDYLGLEGMIGDEVKEVAVPKAKAVPKQLAQEEDKAEDKTVAIPAITTDKTTNAERELTVDDVIEGIRADDVGTLEKVKTDTVTDVVVDTKVTVDKKDMKLDKDIILKFPFCLPWDLVKCIEAMLPNGEVNPPKFMVPFKIRAFGSEKDYIINEKIEVDFAKFDAVAVVIRFFTTVMFVFGIVKITRQMIGA